jgi:DMSO/TMAO reductase YedYZ molybdopterin-dependent catalytic subunit
MPIRPAIFAFLLTASLFAQTPLSVTGAVKQPLQLTADDLAKMPRTTVTVKEQGRDVTYEGVLVYEILKKAGAPVDKELSGKNMALCLLATARDGYSAVYALAEFDPGFTDNRIVVADKIDGKPLSAGQGPFRIVVPNQKKGARSVRMLEKLRVIPVE